MIYLDHLFCLALNNEYAGLVKFATIDSSQSRVLYVRPRLSALETYFYKRVWQRFVQYYS